MSNGPALRHSLMQLWKAARVLWSSRARAAEAFSKRECLERARLARAFNEAKYLKANPDVAEAVRNGRFESGRSHWDEHGYREEQAGLRLPLWRSSSSLVHLKEGLCLSPKEMAKLVRTLGLGVDQLDLPILKYSVVHQWIDVLDRLDGLRAHPLISIVMPVYDPAPGALGLAIESVLYQLYENWELCIIDDKSPSEATRDIIARYAGQDSRIRYVFREENGHIAAASNQGLAMAGGDFIAFLDHDDELTPDALAQIAIAVEMQPDVDFLYSDEDKIDESGDLQDQVLKPDWSPEFILNCGFTAHLSVFSRSILDRLGGFRSEFDGAQDYDLALRASEITDRIVHIPAVLYHWRVSPRSTAGGGEAKPYALERAKDALREHMARRNLKGSVSAADLPGHTCFTPELDEDDMVSIIIPTAGGNGEFGGRHINFVVNCVESIVAKSSYAHREIIVVHNGDLSGDMLARLTAADVRLVRYDAPGFNLAQKMNLGSEHASGAHLIFMNDDTEVISPGWIEGLLRFNQMPGVGVVGAKLYFADGTIQHVGVSIDRGEPNHPMLGAPATASGPMGFAKLPHNVSAVTGACFMTRAALFKSLGGFDLAFDVNYNDVDYCLRVVDAGARIVMNPACELYHFQSSSRDFSVRPDEFRRFTERWGARYQNERYHRTRPYLV